VAPALADSKEEATVDGECGDGSADVLVGTKLRRPEVTRGLRRVRRSFPKPDVLIGSEVSALIEHAPTLKHKAIFMLMYSAGLRVSEVLALGLSVVTLPFLLQAV